MTTWRLQVVGDHDRLHDAFIDAETSTRVGDLQQALNDAGFAGQSLSLSGRSPARTRSSASSTSSTATASAAGDRCTPSRPSARAASSSP